METVVACDNELVCNGVYVVLVGVLAEGLDDFAGDGFVLGGVGGHCSFPFLVSVLTFIIVVVCDGVCKFVGVFF